MVNYKMFDILETTGHRAKWTKIWTSGVSIYYRVPLTVIYVFKFGLGSLGAFPIFDDLVSWKRPVIERNRPKFGPQG